MRSLRRAGFLLALTSALVLAGAHPARAQGFGVGGHLAFVKADSESAEDGSVRFTGGHIRLTGVRSGIEVSIDRHSETFEALNEKIVQTPIQASLLLYLAGGGFKPYLMGGPGWYRTRVESLSGGTDDETTRKFGWHGGFGAEIRGGRHVGIHADYRYTFLSFKDEDRTGIGNFLPGHNGSMWTAGATIYF